MQALAGTGGVDAPLCSRQAGSAGGARSPRATRAGADCVIEEVAGHFVPWPRRRALPMGCQTDTTDIDGGGDAFSTPRSPPLWVLGAAHGLEIARCVERAAVF